MWKTVSSRGVLESVGRVTVNTPVLFFASSPDLVLSLDDDSFKIIIIKKNAFTIMSLSFLTDRSGQTL